MSSMLVSAFEESFRTLAREYHKAADDRIVWLDAPATLDDAQARQACITAAFFMGSLGQALERAADSLAERNDEIAASFSRMRD